MDSLTFITALRADPAARVFIDRYGIANTAHADPAGAGWVAHPKSADEAGRVIREDRLFAAADSFAWRLEQSRVIARRYDPGPRGALVDVQLAVAPSLGFEEKHGPWGHERHEIFGDRTVVVERDELEVFLAANPSAVVV